MSVIEPNPESVLSTRSAPTDLRWLLQVTALAVVMGVLFGLTVASSRRQRESGRVGRLSVSSAILSSYQQQNERLQESIKRLRERVATFEESQRSDNTELEELRMRLQSVKAQTGIAPVSGPGLKITLQDGTPIAGDDLNDPLIHDHDINRLISDLKAAGATHLAISGADETNVQRIIVTTSARCVGAVAMVNGISLSSPFRIFALGDPRRLREYLERPGGYVRERQFDARKMIGYEESSLLELPEYKGTFKPRLARPLTNPDGEPASEN